MILRKTGSISDSIAGSKTWPQRFGSETFITIKAPEVIF